MTLHFVNLTLGTKTYKDKVSTEGCDDVSDFRGAIKNKFSPLLDSYATAQLTLLQPDGTSQIDPETPVTNLKEIPRKPMVVTVLELPMVFFLSCGILLTAKTYLNVQSSKLEKSTANNSKEYCIRKISTW